MPTAHHDLPYTCLASTHVSHTLSYPLNLQAIAEALEWLEENPDADADEYKDKLKEVEDVVNPIVTAAYGAAGGEGGGGEDSGDHDEL